jgi:hypothetical protein
MVVHQTGSRRSPRRAQPAPSDLDANIAALALHCIGRGNTEVFKIADPDCPAVHQIADLVADAMHHEWRVVPLSEDESPGPVGETPWSGPAPLSRRHVAGARDRIPAGDQLRGRHAGTGGSCAPRGGRA